MEQLIILVVIGAFLVESTVLVVLLLGAKRQKNPRQTEVDGKTAEAILKGLENNEFKMHLQFVVENKTKKITSAEALSRWHHPEKGIVSPFHFIGKMEVMGVISDHDFKMFEHVCRQLEKWENTEYKDIMISCNFTRETLSEKDFVDKLKEIADRYQFDKKKLVIEITEDVIERDRELAKSNMMRCKELGFRIYLDDIGSGYTALANLCDYPIDVVKIERDILLKADEPKGKALLAGIVALAHSLDIEVICEGVETEEQNALMAETGCDYIQGWYYHKDMPADECETFMRRYSLERGI